MSTRDDELANLQERYPGSKRCEEGGTTFYFIPSLPLPAGCTPAATDVLLCPTPRDGYPSRLYFADQVQSPAGLNWHVHPRILERNWHAFSWQNVPDRPLLDLVLAYVRALLP